MGTRSLAVRDRIRGSNHIRRRPVKSIGILNTGNRPVSTAATTVHIPVRAVLIAVHLSGHHPGILRRCSTGAVRHGIVIRVCKNCSRTHIRLHIVGAVCDTESDLVINARHCNRGQFLLRPRKGRKILVEPLLIILRLREAERKLHRRSLEATVHVPIGNPAPVVQFPNTWFIDVDIGFAKLLVFCCVINFIHTIHNLLEFFDNVLPHCIARL